MAGVEYTNVQMMCACMQNWHCRGMEREAPNYQVTKAHLVVNHWITNNPNDQLRPEDLENEAATGRKPSYTDRMYPAGAEESGNQIRLVMKVMVMLSIPKKV